jgi:hypothetical protein
VLGLADVINDTAFTGYPAHCLLCKVARGLISLTGGIMRLMSRSFAALAVALALSGAAYAGQAKPAAAAASKPAKAAKMTAITTSGTVTKFDAASNTLTVSTPKGDSTFVVDSSASVTANGKKVMASDLPSHVGHKVTVRYTESGGQKTAQSVRVTMAAPKTASASTKKAGTTKKS